MERLALTPDFHDHKTGQMVELHAHAEGQVLVAVEGSMNVWFGDARLQLDARVALWVPPGVPHAARSLQDTAFRGIMIDAPQAEAMPQRVARFAASSLFLAATPGLVHARAAQRASAAQLVRDELASRLSPQRGPVLPRDPRFADLCARVLQDVAEAPGLEQAASAARMSRRSFTRAFRAATDLGWTEWVREARLAQAAVLLAEGARVTDAALAVGYATPSAFSFAFHRGTGTPPTRVRG